MCMATYDDLNEVVSCFTIIILLCNDNTFTNTIKVVNEMTKWDRTMVFRFALI